MLIFANMPILLSVIMPSVVMLKVIVQLTWVTVGQNKIRKALY
jgi:hypothetical protein